MGEIFKVKINDKEIKIGVLSDNGKRLTIFKNDSQIYKNLNSFGIAENVINYLIAKGVKEIVILWHKTDGTEELFKTKIETWKFGNKIQHGKLETQLHLSIPFLRKITQKEVGVLEL